MREDGASTDGEDYDDGSSRLGSQRSTCDTDSTHDMDMDSPRPDARLSFSQQHSPLSPLIPDEEEVEVVVDTTGKLDLSFPAAASSLGLPLLPSSLPLPSASPLAPPTHPSMSSTPVKVEHPLAMAMPSPSLAAT